MKLEITETIRLKQKPDVVFDYLSDPENWPKFNSKIKVLVHENKKVIGSIEYKRKMIDFDGYINECIRPKEINAEFSFNDERRDEKMKLKYSIEESMFYTKVIESTVFDAEVPLWAWLLIKFITIFGKAVGTSNLQKLKQNLSEIQK